MGLKRRPPSVIDILLECNNYFGDIFSFSLTNNAAIFLMSAHVITYSYLISLGILPLTPQFE